MTKKRPGLKLKKITLQGFKSFADRTTVEFSDGITAVVGPNGCGKSNISDAFRWVFGEQSAKSLRGQKMHDVIFAGTTSRKPLNVAEVTLTLTGNDGILPIEYNEVSVTRRLHRSGESEYLINGNPVRMRDLHSLFLDSGIGRNSFSIFEQGKMDQVINQTPLDRRHIFEEAAGILRFLQRKREALRKLEQTQANMRRVHDIRSEVQRQVSVLEQQAEAAKLFKENKSKLEFLEKAVAVAKWDEVHTKHVEKEAEVKQQQSWLEQAQALQLMLLCQMQDAKKSLAQSEMLFRKRSEALYQTRSSQAIKDKERQTQEEKLNEAKLRIKKLTLELEDLKQKRQVSRSVYDNNKSRQEAVTTAATEAQTALEAARQASHQIEFRTVEMRSQQQSAQRQRLELVQNESRLESDLQQHRVRLESAGEQLKQAQKERLRLAEEAAVHDGLLTGKEKEVKEGSAAVEREKGRLEEIKGELTEVDATLRGSEEKLEKALHRYAESNARLRALERLQEDMEGLGSGSKQLLQESQRVGSALFGKLRGLYEYVKPEKGSEAAVAAVMQPYLETLVVETRQDFDAVLAFARAQDLQGFSLICLEGLSDEVTTTQLPSLLSRVVQDPVAKHFMGRTAVAESVDEALGVLEGQNGLEVVTTEGRYFDRHRVLFFTAPGEGNTFLREAEIQTLRSDLKSLKAETLELERQVAQLRERKAILEADMRTIDGTLRNLEMRFVETNFQYQQAVEQKKKGAQLDEELALREQHVQESIDQLNAAVKDLGAAHQTAKEKSLTAQEQSSGLDGSLIDMEEDLKQKRSVLQEAELIHQKASEEKRQLDHMLQLFEVKDQEAEQQEQRIEEELEGLYELRVAAEGKQSTSTEDLKYVEGQLKEASQEAEAAEKQLEAWKQRIEHIEGNQSKAAESAKKIEEKKHQAGIQIAQLESTLEGLVADLQERHQLSIERARELGLVLEEPLDQSEKELRQLRRAQEKAGDINLASIEEYETHKVRAEFLEKQLEDLDASKEELSEIITKLDGESRKLFVETFEQIRENFQKNFKILFRGGEADLTFLDADDILEAGIDIIAKPPGKAMRSIGLLSGGEKCMTAMALLFAIFEVRSAPFCMLDEIDAPLDDSNVSRFVDVVKQFTDRSQFIIITHNKRTMAIADRLYGVSMQEKGVSRVLSMQFSHKEETEELEAVEVQEVGG